jgi:hypothetical protein
MNHGFPKSLARRRADYFAIGEISPASTLRWNAKVLRTGVEASITEPPSAATTLVRVLSVAFMPVFVQDTVRVTVSLLRHLADRSLQVRLRQLEVTTCSSKDAVALARSA